MKILDKIFKFNGGIQAETKKEVSTRNSIKFLPIPPEIRLPLRQHIGNIAKLKVKVGDYVLKGQLIAEADGNISAAIHAPTSGKIKSVEKLLIPHPSGLPDFCVTLIPDKKDQWIKKTPFNWKKVGIEETNRLLLSSGIVGLGGAAFPSHLKLGTNRKNQIKTLIINAAECEPYITCDDMLMRERSETLIESIKLVQSMLGAKESILSLIHI